MDEHVNMLKKPMTEQEQIELSESLDDFLQMYENGFLDQLHDDIELSSEDLQYELGALYRIVKILDNRAIE